MATIAFTRHLQAVAPQQALRVEGETVAALLDALDRDHPRLRDYLLDDQGRVRCHVAIFVDGALVPRESVLALPVSDASDVFVMQALSGG